MKFKSQPAPHISYRETTTGVMANVLIALLVLYAMAFFYYGPRALVLGAISAVTAMLAEFAGNRLAGRPLRWRDWSAIVTGLLIPLMMPASIPFHIPVIAVLFGILVVKHPFGGTGHNLFNPAAAGVAFAIVSFPDKIFQYPLPLQMVPIFPTEELLTVSSPMLNVGVGGVPQYDLLSMALGNVPGPMGATNAVVLLACLLFLLARRTLQWDTPVFFLLTTASIAFYSHTLGATRLQSMLYEMMNGLLLFGAVFLLGDPVTRPKRDWANVLYAVLTGVMVMLFRRGGNIQEEFVFALLLMNALVWPIDLFVERLTQAVRRKRVETIHR